jgi:hypothetical protein
MRWLWEYRSSFTTLPNPRQQTTDSSSKTKDITSKETTHHQTSGESDPSQLSHHPLFHDP